MMEIIASICGIGSQLDGLEELNLLSQINKKLRIVFNSCIVHWKG